MSLSFLLIVALGVLVPGAFWFHRYTGLTRDKALLALIGSLIVGGIHVYSRVANLHSHIRGSQEVESVLRLMAGCVFFVFLTALVLRLWDRWMCDRATPEERLPGVAGVRAWFSTPNVIVGALLVLCAWAGHDISPFLGIASVAALLAAPALIRAIPAAPNPVPIREDLSAEREKIVAMLEAGKLTPEESAELLQALGDSARAPAQKVPLTDSQRLMLIGAALVALGFFLPWLVVNPGKEASRLMSETGMKMGLKLPGGSMSFPNPEIGTPTVHYAGGDIQRGLGWAVLALAIVAALLPYLATTLDSATARTVRLLCLGLGAFILLYLLTQNLRFVGIGLIIAGCGYALEVAGALRERRVLVA